jgi:uncharacterized membrane protein YqjE
MARSAAPQSLGNNSEPSIGDLVAQAIRDVTQLVKFEIDLAKMELRDDARRLGLSAALLAIVAFTGCLILVLLCFAFVAGVCLVLAAIAVLVVYIKVRGMSGLRKTRQTVQQDLAMLKREDTTPAPPAVEAG